MSLKLFMTGQAENQSFNKLKPNAVIALLQYRFTRFLLIGGINTAFSYSLYAFLVFLGINYAIASLMALIGGILFSFKTQAIFVFNNSDNRLLGRFIICWVLIYFGNIAFIKAMLMLGLDAYVAGALAIPPIAILSYLMQKFIVFRGTASSADSSLQIQPQSITSASGR